jgi:hypothetical protein
LPSATRDSIRARYFLAVSLVGFFDRRIFQRPSLSLYLTNHLGLLRGGYDMDTASGCFEKT